MLRMRLALGVVPTGAASHLRCSGREAEYKAMSFNHPKYIIDRLV
jgi:hypothetical protein